MEGGARSNSLFSLFLTMKKHLLIGASLLALGITTTAIYAQVTGTSVVDKMKAVAHSFTLAATLNPSDSGLTSDPVK